MSEYVEITTEDIIRALKQPELPQAFGHLLEIVDYQPTRACALGQIIFKYQLDAEDFQDKFEDIVSPKMHDDEEERRYYSVCDDVIELNDNDRKPLPEIGRHLRKVLQPRRTIRVLKHDYREDAKERGGNLDI